MVIRYPNGRPYTGNSTKHLDKKQAFSQSTYSNRGMNLETMINDSIRYYRQQNQMIIHKKPTPIQVVSVDYPKRSRAKITEAYYRKASTTDYNGVYKGFYIDFEAKETNNKTSFPFSNFHQHQIDHMRNCLNQGAICFVVMYFSTLNEFYLVQSQTIIEFYDHMIQNNGPKSMKITHIQNMGIKLKQGIRPKLYLKEAIDQLLF